MQPVEIVQGMWIAYREGGVDAALPLIDADVLFVTHDGREFHGHEGIRAFFAEFAARGERFAAAPFTFEPVAGGVLVAGHRRVSTGTGTDGEYLWFSHAVSAEAITRLAAHTSRASALAELRGDEHGAGRPEQGARP